MPPNSELVRMIEEAAAAASPSRAHIAAVQLEVDAGADVVAAVTKVQALFRGRTGRMRVAHDGSRLGTQLDRAQSALSTLQLAMESSSEQSKPNMIGELRTFVHQTSKLLSCAQSSLALRIALDDGHQRTTRTNYLIPLNERIGPEPETRTWETEWDELRRAKVCQRAARELRQPAQGGGQSEDGQRQELALICIRPA